MSTKVKRHCRMVMAVNHKIEAIKRVDNGESKASVARDIGVPESTLRGWCKNEKLRSMSCTSSSFEADSGDEPTSKRLHAESPTMPSTSPIVDQASRLSPWESWYASINTTTKLCAGHIVAPKNNEPLRNKQPATVKMQKPFKKGEKLQMALNKIFATNAKLRKNINNDRDANEIKACGN